MLIGSFLIELTFLRQVSTLPEILIIIGNVESKKKFSDNHAHNILELYDISTDPYRSVQYQFRSGSPQVKRNLISR